MSRVSVFHGNRRRERILHFSPPTRLYRCARVVNDLVKAINKGAGVMLYDLSYRKHLGGNGLCWLPGCPSSSFVPMFNAACSKCMMERGCDGLLCVLLCMFTAFGAMLCCAMPAVLCHAMLLRIAVVGALQLM